MNPTIETYTPGQTPSATAFMAERDLDSHGFFLSPFLQRGFHVLDAGCGPGTISTGIASAVFPGTVTAVDLSQAQVEFARRQSEGREIVNIHFATASAYELPFADETFDLVFSHALLEHLVEPRKALREFHRVTRPGGFVAVCSPDWDEFEVRPYPIRVRNAMRAYRNLQEANGGNTRAGEHLHEWVADAGFTPLTHEHWIEEYEDASRIAEYLAHQLDRAGQAEHAKALREWAEQPEARFRQCWKYAAAVRADDHRRMSRVTE